MTGDENKHIGAGYQSAYVFGSDAIGWAGVRVARWQLHERLGQPFELEITATQKRVDGPIDLAKLIDQPATLSIATERRWRPVHGVIIGAEEIDRTSELSLYRLLVAPPFWRMSQRVRYRTFVDRTLREILVSLLENRSMAASSGVGGLASSRPLDPPSEVRPPLYQAARGVYRFAVTEANARLDDPKLRSYVVQYGESDLDVFHRLLEEEGLTYFTEHGDDAVCLTVVDRPGVVSPFEREEKVKLISGTSGLEQSDGEHITVLRRGHRLDWGTTTARDWDPARPQAPQASTTFDERPTESAIDPALYVRDVFPSRDGHVAQPCVVPSQLAVERRAAERSRVTGRSTVRALSPGMKVRVEDRSGLVEPMTLVITAVTAYGSDHVPEGTFLDREAWGPHGLRAKGERFYENELVAVPEDVPYRPPLTTRPPRIHGVQTAIVSADEVGGDRPEIHRNDAGDVRLRFPWDERIEPGRPSSIWVRVSQGWAGAGYGQVFTPRVGQEVLVAYEHGDPERPLVVGRVYDAIQPIPYTKPTISTIKSKSSPESDGFNELRFDDEAGNEEVYLRAEKNLNELVKASHSTSVGGDQSNGVGGNQSNSVTGDRTHGVGGKEDNTVSGNQTNVVGAFLKTTVGASEERNVAAFRNTNIGSGDSLHVGAWRSVEAGAGHKRVVGGPDHVQAASRDVRIAGVHNMDAAGHKMRAGVANVITGPRFHADGGSSALDMVSGRAEITNGAASISMIGGVVFINADAIVMIGTGATMVLGDVIDARAGTIKLNG